AAIEKPRRYLGTVVTRLCLDRMKSAQARREVYLGQWLPEPVVDEVFDGEGAVDLAHDISVARRAVFGWRRQTRCSAQPDGGAARIPRFVCRRCPQKPGARGHGGAARHGQRAPGLRFARKRWFYRYDGRRTPCRSYRRNLLDPQSGQAAARLVLNRFRGYRRKSYRRTSTCRSYSHQQHTVNLERRDACPLCPTARRCY